MARQHKILGTIYLIHFDEPVGDRTRPRMSASHYIGWTTDLETRLEQHRKGLGAALMAYVATKGIAWKVVRLWEGSTRDDERRLKKSGHFADRLCPECRR